jgi:hypothetical protein
MKDYIPKNFDLSWIPFLNVTLICNFSKFDVIPYFTFSYISGFSIITGFGFFDIIVWGWK